jgi:hypothetical protein
MLYFLVRGRQRKTYELRLSSEGDGFELIVHDEQNHEFIEKFTSLEHALQREDELLSAWRALGWHDPPTVGSRK